MKRLAVLAIAAATLSAAIPAEAAIPGKPAGTTGSAGRSSSQCFTSTVGKKATSCPTMAPVVFWP